MKIFIYFIIFLFLFCVGLLLIYIGIKQRLYEFKKYIIFMKKETLVETLKESISNINDSSTYNYNLCTLSFFFVDNTYYKLFFNIIGIPIKKDISILNSKKDVEFFCYKIIKTNENNIYNLTLIKENACFKLNNIYNFRSEFILINDYKFEDIFKNLFKDDIEKTFDKSDIVYLPIKLEKMTIKLEKNILE